MKPDYARADLVLHEEKKMKKHDPMMYPNAAFLGFLVAVGIGLVALPFAVLTGTPPAIWGSLSIASMPLGALLGIAIKWASNG